MDPNAATTINGIGQGAVVTYTCSSGYQDSVAADTTHINTCTSGAWVATGDGPCVGEYSIGNSQRTVSWYLILEIFVILLTIQMAQSLHKNLDLRGIYVYVNI